MEEYEPNPKNAPKIEVKAEGEEDKKEDEWY